MVLQVSVRVVFWFSFLFIQILGANLFALPNGLIYVVHHRPFWTYESSLFHPIHAGRASSRFFLKMDGDDTGDHISDKNPLYAELSAIYWAWKNRPSVDFVGFMHYRRYLGVIGTNNLICSQAQLRKNRAFIQEFCNEQKIRELMSQYDVVLPFPWSFGCSVGEQYSLYHGKDTYQIMMDVLKEKHPEDQQLIQERFEESCTSYLQNIFIMRDELFQEYAEWIFPILFEIERRVPPSSRLFGFMGERLTNFFLFWKQQNSGIKIKSVPMLMVNE